MNRIINRKIRTQYFIKKGKTFKAVKNNPQKFPKGYIQDSRQTKKFNWWKISTGSSA